MRKHSSVFNKKVNFIKKDLNSGENIEEVLSDDEMADGSFGSDYENEEGENPDNKIDMKRSVFVGRFKENNNNNKNMLKQSVQDGFLKNRLRDKLYKRERAQSK